MEFRFVNHGPGGADDRKTIRSHVMKGRNSGKTHVSRGRAGRKREARDEPAPPPRDTVATFRRMVGNGLSTCSPGAELSPHDRLLFHQRKQPCNIARRGLSGPQGTSDQTIALVCMLVCQESIRGDLEKYKTHLLGLARMVELRGGIHALKEKDDVIHKTCRADIQYALHAGTPPLYSYDSVPQRVAQRVSQYEACSQRPLPAAFSAAELSTRQAVRGLDDISILLAGCGPEWKLTAHEYSATILSVGYRMLRVRGHGSRGLDATQDACVLGALCFYSSLLLQLGRRRHLVYAELSRRLKASLDGLLDGCRRPRSRSTVVWLLVMGAVSVFEEKDDVWLLPALARVSGLAGLGNWGEVCRVLEEYPWIASIHNGPGERVWNRVGLYCQVIDTTQ
ncbi:hypothetical protein LX36DRAFT_708918 [Colletotrichum falcatum]|nr:hypothetical protein LX36DRAFT_708918 [Colletotrichum falcatum]